MSERNLKIAIIVVVFILILTASALIYIWAINSRKEQEEVAGDENAIIEKEENITLLRSNSIFYTVKNMIQGYLNASASNLSEELYNILDKQYIESEGITKDNITEKLPKLGNNILYYAQKMYIKEMEKGDILYCYGQIETYKTDEEREIIKNKDLTDIYFKVIIDYENASFSIEPINKNQYENVINAQIDGNQEINIKRNKNNVLNYANASDDSIIASYMATYRELCQENINQAYALLNEEYKKIRFPTINEFKKYIQSTQEQFTKMYINSYEKETIEDTVVYICKDKLKNVYIFKETSPMQYTIELDDYTIENTNFNEKYKNASNRDKGILNVDKFFKMINMTDYKAAYAVLDETFKQNNFKTELDFENYMHSNLFRYNQVNYQEYSDKITDILTFKLSLTDATAKEDRQIAFNIVMKLGEGNNFTMSFEIVEE